MARSAYERNEHRSAHNFRAIGRLKDGISLDQAQTQLSAIGARLEQAYPLSNKNQSFRAVTAREQMVGSVKNTLYLLLGSVALVLLIACANVANLLLARATSRTREIAVPLGAGRANIVRMVLRTGAQLAAWGLGLGFAGALAATRLVESMLFGVKATDPSNFAIMAAAVGLVAIAACGIPAWRATRIDPLEALRQE